MGTRGLRTDGNLFFRLVAGLFFFGALVALAGGLLVGWRVSEDTSTDAGGVGAAALALGGAGAALLLAWMGAVVWLLDEIAGRG